MAENTSEMAGQGGRSALSRARIIEAAVAYADAEGVERLTMRRVADALGCAPMSLYNHVRNKSDLLAGMADAVAAEIDVVAESESVEWRGAMRSIAESAHEILRRHPWAVTEWIAQAPGPARLRFMEAVLGGLAKAGFSDELVYHGYHAVTMHIVGFTQQELGYARMGDDVLQSIASDFIESLGDQFPHVAQHARAHFDGSDHGDEFLFVLDLILEGLDDAR